MALARAVRAIDEFRVDGVITTLPAQRLLLEHDSVRAAVHDTGTVQALVTEQALLAHDAESHRPVIGGVAQAVRREVRQCREDLRGAHSDLGAPVVGGARDAFGRGEPGGTSQIPAGTHQERDRLLVSPMNGTVVAARSPPGIVWRKATPCTCWKR